MTTNFGKIGKMTFIWRSETDRNMPVAIPKYLMATLLLHAMQI